MSWSGFRKSFEGNPQQGTLFDVRDVPSQPVDSPGLRKRTRREEMLAAMPSVYSGMGDPDRQEVQDKIFDRRGAGLHEPGTDAGSQTGRYQRAVISHQLADTTTVPPSDLSGIEEIGVGRSLPPGVGGEYVDETREISLPGGELDMGTITHELGHHVSMHHEGNAVGVVGDSLAQLRSGALISPGEEGRADAYALTHAPEARTGRTYANMVRGISSTRYVPEREARGHPLDSEERRVQGLPTSLELPNQPMLPFPRRRD